jgi:hypothetical protein
VRGFMDSEVRELDARDQTVLLVAAGLVHLVGPSRFGVGASRAKKFSKGVDGHLAGDLAGGMPTHAVGHHVEVVFVRQHERVLVVGSLHPHVSVPNR